MSSNLNRLEIKPGYVEALWDTNLIMRNIKSVGSCALQSLNRKPAQPSVLLTDTEESTHKRKLG